MGRHPKPFTKAEAASIFEPHLLVRGTRVATGDDGVRVGLCENKLTAAIHRTAALTRSERFVVTATSHRSPAYSSYTARDQRH
jgi:hypothetical protein